MGYRVSGPVSYEKDDGYRVFAIGGSTTQEILLDDTRTWTRGLENWLRNDGKPTAQVINTGLSGTRAVHHLATLKKIIPLNPDVVIFLVGINDWNRHIRQHYDSEYRTLQEMLAKRVNRIRSELKLERSLLGRPLRALYAAAGLTAKRSSFEVNNGEYFSKQRGSLNKSNKISFKPDAVENEYTDTIDQIVSTCSQHQIKCMFITQPNGYQDGASKSYKDSFWMTPTDSPDFTADFSSMMHIAKLYNGHLKAVAKKTGIAICDAAAQLPPEQKYFHDDCHFTEFGSKEMSRAIQTCFAEAGL